MSRSITTSIGHPTWLAPVRSLTFSRTRFIAVGDEGNAPAAGLLLRSTRRISRNELRCDSEMTRWSAMHHLKEEIDCRPADIHERLTNRSQRNREMRRQVDVVETYDGHILRHSLPQLPKAMDRTDCDIVVRSQNPVRVRILAQEFVGSSVAIVRVPAGFHTHAGPTSRLPTTLSLLRLEPIAGPCQVCNPSTALTHHVNDSRLRAPEIVAASSSQAGGHHPVGNHTDWKAFCVSLRLLERSRGPRVQHQAVYAKLKEMLSCGRKGRFPVVWHRDANRPVAARPALFGDRQAHLRWAEQARVHRDLSDDHRRTGGQRSRSKIPPIPQSSDRRFHAAPCIGANPRRIIQDPGYSLMGHPRM